MIRFLRVLSGLVFGLMSSGAVLAAPVLYTGPTIIATQATGTSLSFTDVLVPGSIGISRGNLGILCNPLAGDTCGRGANGPTGIDFAFSDRNGNPTLTPGDFTVVESLTYSDLLTASGTNRFGPAFDMLFGFMRFSDGADTVYASFTGLDWEMRRGGGGFSYARSTPAIVPVPGAGVLLASALGVGAVLRRRKGRLSTSI